MAGAAEGTSEQRVVKDKREGRWISEFAICCVRFRRILVNKAALRGVRANFWRIIRILAGCRAWLVRVSSWRKRVEFRIRLADRQHRRGPERGPSDVVRSGGDKCSLEHLSLTLA